MKSNSWQGIGSDGDVLLTPYVPEGITGYDDDDDSAPRVQQLYCSYLKLLHVSIPGDQGQAQMWKGRSVENI